MLVDFKPRRWGFSGIIGGFVALGLLSSLLSWRRNPASVPSAGVGD